MEHWEYDNEKKKYNLFDVNDQHFIGSYSREKFYDYLQHDVSTVFYGKTVMSERKLHPENSRVNYYQLKNKERDVVIFLSDKDVEEMRQLDRIRKEINHRSASISLMNIGKLKTWVKVGIGVTLGAGGMAVGYSMMNAGPDFHIPIPAEQVYEEVNQKLENDGKDIYNLDERWNAVSDLYKHTDRNEIRHRYELDHVAVSIEMVEKQYNEDRITKTVAEEKLEEINSDYKQMMEEYDQQQTQARTK